MKPGYLRKNGVPYSANAVVTEYLERFDQPDGGALLMDITEVNDPTYLATPFWTSTHFKKQRDASGLESDALRHQRTDCIKGKQVKLTNRYVILLALLVTCAVLFGQPARPAPAADAPGFDMSGYWTPAMHEDALERGGGSEFGDYGGFAINEAGRLWALSYDPSRVTLKYHQCDAYVAPYQMRATGTSGSGRSGIRTTSV